MTYIDLETPLIPEARHDTVDEVGGDRFDCVATAAHQVNVRLLGRGVIGRSAVIEMGVGNEAELLEEFEVAVDR